MRLSADIYRTFGRMTDETLIDMLSSPRRSMLFIRRTSSSSGRRPRRAVAFLFLTARFGLALSQPAFASNVTVASPVNGTTVPSPVWIRAHNIGCDGLTPTAPGYSIDSSSTLTNGVTVNDIDVTTAMAAGSRTVHFKSWTSNGICPVVSTSFKVAGGAAFSF